MLKKYVIKNGTVLSILNGEEKKADVLVEDGIITKIAANIETEEAEVFNADGMYVSVGWLDAHCHFANFVEGKGGISPQDDLLRQGVTYALDLGSLGPENYEEYRETILWRTDLRFMSYLNISRRGCGGTANRTDFDGPEDIDREKVIEVANRYRHELLGLKARIDDKFCYDPVYVMEQLRSLADELNMPIAVHAPRSRIGVEKLLTYLKKGDVLCHTLAGNSEVMKVIDDEGNVKQCVLDGRDRGVIFDLSHGTNAYSYDTAEAAWKAGFFVDTISSDLHGGNIRGPVYNLGVVMTKVRGLTQKPWWWVLNKTIAAPVALQGIKDKETELREGMKADMTVFRIEEGEFTYLDSKKESRTFNEKATAVYTCTGTKVYTCRDRASE
ncbi:MAG: hypothetical protein IKF00_02170 [Solobacterium sp.]|nr:hypothetical protein [Solobacterium sp.]MBR2843998.1 hypothetical protein [Solobacterium sp.]